MARDNLLAFDHCRRFVYSWWPSSGLDRDQRCHIHSRALAGHPSHLGRSDSSSVLQHFLREAPSVGGGHLLQCPHLQLCPSHRLSLGDDTDQAERSCSFHAIY